MPFVEPTGPLPTSRRRQISSRAASPSNPTSLGLSARWVRSTTDGRSYLRQAANADRSAAVEADSLARACYEKLRALEPDEREHAARLATVLFTTDRPGTWRLLRPLRMVSAGGATLIQKPDGSVLAGGPNPAHDTYDITAETDVAGITAFRLEILTDPSLPFGVSGRATENGNFCLSEWSVTIQPRNSLDPPRQVRWKDAWSDHRLTAAEHYAGVRMHIGLAIDGDPRTYWEPWPENSSSHWAIFVPIEAIGQAGGSRLTITLTSHAYALHNFGRFRISCTTESDPAALTMLASPGVKVHDGWSRLGAAYARRGDWQLALAALDKAAARPFDCTPAGFLLLGLVHDHLGHADMARRSIEQAIVMLRSQPLLSGLPLLAASTPSAIRLAALAEAERVIERAAEDAELRVDSPGHGLTQADTADLLESGESSARRGQWSHAIAEIARAVELNRGSLVIPARLGLLYLMAGDQAGYRAFSRDLTERVYQAGTAPYLSHQVSSVCVLGPDALGDYSQAIALAERCWPAYARKTTATG